VKTTASWDTTSCSLVKSVSPKAVISSGHTFRNRLKSTRMERCTQKEYMFFENAFFAIFIRLHHRSGAGLAQAV
jgi:hypothetical protein